MPQSALTAGKVQECESRSRFPLKRYTFQRVHFGKKRGYRCCRSPYSSVIANGDSPLGCLRRFAGIHAALLSMPVRPLGYRHGPTGRPSGRSSRRALPCAALEAAVTKWIFVLYQGESLLWREYTLLVLASAVAAKEATSLIGITVAIRIVAVLICTPLCGYS